MSKYCNIFVLGNHWKRYSRDTTVMLSLHLQFTSIEKKYKTEIRILFPLWLVASKISTFQVRITALLLYQKYSVLHVGICLVLLWYFNDPRFPKDDRMKEWLAFCRTELHDDKIETKEHDRLCIRHFHESSIIRKKKCTRLASDAIPRSFEKKMWVIITKTRMFHLQQLLGYQFWNLF